MVGLASYGLTQRHRGTEAQREQEAIEERSPWWPAALAVLALSGIFVGWHCGQLPIRHAATADDAGATSVIAPDLALYRDVVREVRGGQDYYDAARQRIPQYGFPIASPLNWRLPTYAWLLSRLPGEWAIQAALVGLSVFALALTFAAKQSGFAVEVSKAHPPAMAVATTCVMFGVAKWSIDGQAYLAQEVWAAVLIAISLAAGALTKADTHGELVSSRSPRLRFGLVCLSVAAGIAALLFRELALPWCVAAGGMAIYKRRWGQAAAWILGIAAFCGFFAWHVGQVEAQLAGTDVAASAGISQWLRFGGLDFVLLTTRMNSLLFAAPGWLVWLYILIALIGLSRSKLEASQTACLAALMYLLAFAIVGRPENFYWGLMPAPLLAWGAVDGAWQVATAASPRAKAVSLPTTHRQLATDK
jgi:hypothetical protein